jgi:hypothetical protein
MSEVQINKYDCVNQNFGLGEKSCTGHWQRDSSEMRNQYSTKSTVTAVHWIQYIQDSINEHMTMTTS